MDLISPGRRAFVRDENINQSNSDYESDHRLEIADCRALSSEIDEDMQNDSYAEDISHPPVCGRPSSQETISGAGRALSYVAGNRELNRAITDEPWNPFSSKDDFNLASWLVRSKVTKSQIAAYFAEGLGGTNSRALRSAYIMPQHLDVLDPFSEYLVWTEAIIEDGQHTATFYYLNIIDCVRYLFHQHQQNVKTSPSPPRGVMVPLVLLVHPDPPWSTFSVKFQKGWIRMDQSGPGGPRGPQPLLVDQERSGPPWTMLRHFPDAGHLWIRYSLHIYSGI